jgi:hypothetical protein
VAVAIGIDRGFALPFRVRDEFATGTPTHGYKSTREGAMTAFAKSWRWPF